MPLYEYQCESCAKRFERIQKFSDPPIETCPSCGAPVKKLVSSPAIQFKGSGWYITDYAKKAAGDKKAGQETTAKSEAASGTSDASASSSGSGTSSETPAKSDATTKKKE